MDALEELGYEIAVTPDRERRYDAGFKRRVVGGFSESRSWPRRVLRRRGARRGRRGRVTALSRLLKVSTKPDQLHSA